MPTLSIAIQYEEGVVDKLNNAVLAYVVQRDMDHLSIPVPTPNQITRLQGTSNVVCVRDLSGSSESEKRLALFLSATDREPDSDEIRKALKRPRICCITQAISPRGVKRTLEECFSPVERIQSRKREVFMSEEDLSLHWHRKIKEIEIREACAQTAHKDLELKITSVRADAAASTKKYQRACNDAKELLHAVLAKAKMAEEGRLLLEARLRGRIADLEKKLNQECTARMETEKKWELLSAETAYLSHDRIFELEAKLKEESKLRQEAEFELEKSNSLLVDRGRTAEAFQKAIRSRDAGVIKTLSTPIGALDSTPQKEYGV